MIPFEYLNNTFSGAISIFTAVFGMAYPLLQECIQRIEDKYICSHIAQRFKQEETYNRFNWLIVVCMIEAVLCPILLQLCVNNIWTCSIVAVQLISVFCLMAYTVRLIQLILIYYDVNRLFDRVKAHHDESELPNLLCICRYASRMDLNVLYVDCMSEIFGFLFEQQRKTPEGQEVVYNQPVAAIINSILRSSYKDRGSYFYERNDITGALLNYTEEKKISEQTYQQIWNTLNYIVHADNEQWFRQYWSLACQYYTFRLSNLRYNDDCSERDRFLEMHRVLGGLLCMHKKYEWLDYILTYTNTLPPRFDLVPSSAVQIFDALIDLEKKADDPFMWQMLAKYNFIGLRGDVYDEKMVVKYVEEYYALLIVRLWSVNDYNITYSDPMTFYSVTEDLDENDKRIRILDRLLLTIRRIYGDYDLQRLSLSVPSKIDVLDMVSAQIKELKLKNEEITGRHEVDDEKVNKIKEEILGAISNRPVILPQGEHREPRGEIKTPVYSNAILGEDLMLKGRHMSVKGIGEMLVEALNANTIMLYGRILTNNRHLRHSYSIRYQDIFKAIDKLGVNEDYVILLLGVYLDNHYAMFGKPDSIREEEGCRYYGDIEILFVDSRQSAIVVMKRSELPFWEFVPNDNPAVGMDEIENVTRVFSNIDHLEATSFYLSLARTFRAEYETKENFALLNVSLNEVNNELDLNTIRPL